MIKNKELIIKIMIIIISFLLAILFSFTPVDNPDYGFHLRTGQDIVKNHFFPLTENYSYTAKGNFNPAYSWIFDSLSYIFYAFGNINGLIYFQIILTFIIFFLVLFNFFKKDLVNKNIFLSGLLALNILFAFSFLLMPRIMIRPHLFGYVFFTVYLLIMDNAAHDQQETGFKLLLKNKNIIAAIIIFLFWVNSHSSFAEGYALLVIWIISVALRDFSQKGKKLNLLGLIGIAIILFVICFCTPNLGRIFAPFVGSTKYTEEFFSLFEILPKSGFFYMFLIMFYVIIFAVISLYYFNKKNYFRSFALVFFAALGVYSVRFLGDAGIVAGILTVPAAKDLTNICETKNNLKHGLIIIFATLAIAQGVLIMHYHNPNGMGMNKSSFPVNSVKYLKQQDIDGRMFNSFEWGGYLIWELQKYPVFVDGRVQVYPEEFINNFRIKILQKPPLYFYEQCQKYGISFAVVPYASNIGRMIANDYSGYLFNNKDWALVYFDNNSLVYIKRGFSKKNDAIITRDEYTMLQPTIMAPPLMDKYLNNDSKRQKLIKELQRSISEYPDCIYSHFCLAYIRFKTGDLTDAIKELETTRKLYPNPQVEILYQQLKKM